MLQVECKPVLSCILGSEGQSIDYSVQEYPIDTNLYDSQTDEEYKKGVLQALLSRMSIQDTKNGEYCIRELSEELRYGRSTISDEPYIGFLNDLFRFYYLDFDGDCYRELEEFNYEMRKERSSNLYDNRYRGGLTIDENGL